LKNCNCLLFFFHELINFQFHHFSYSQTIQYFHHHHNLVFFL